MRLVGNLRDGCHARLESLLPAVHNEMKIGTKLPKAAVESMSIIGEVITAMKLLETDDHG